MATRKPSSHRIDPAATVILTREQAGEIQVYLLKRSLKSGFMAGNYVFPGGRVDSEDRQFDIFKNHIDLDFVDVLVRFGDDLSEAQILSFCVAAIRETLEEAGVFLAHRDNELEARLNQIKKLRFAGVFEKNWFTKLVVNEKWRLAVSTLKRWRIGLLRS